MEIQGVGNTLMFDGIFDETVTQDDIHNAFNSLEEAKTKSPITVDFSKVPYANSSGVVVWLKAIHKIGQALRYVNAPIWLVNQFNILNGYFENGSYVESIHAPYFSKKTQDSKIFTLTLKKDVPILKDYADFEVPNRSDGDKTYECDFVPEQYFFFITENYAIFSEKLK
jgi:hypothetical protein